MKLEALNRVQGVKVLAGKGEGTKTAHTGDIFETRNDAEAERLIKLDAAKEYKVEDRLAGKGEGKSTSTQKKAPAKKAPAKKATGGKPAAKKAETKDTGGEPGDSKKAEDGSDTADDEDLGLND
ncbi:hypothetical protein [Marinobacter sp. DS40M6]|uniref:hypothetical protein n=1 Tax=Marinobacter sp. DS40M6 TaxID=1597776 RepID=UPI002359DE73|nr:hypothetical protein [Marinobacter sp. DS40M6]MDC8457826.1 hypothetical protein [Marinobacter sp. DS40M6]